MKNDRRMRNEKNKKHRKENAVQQNEIEVFFFRLLFCVCVLVFKDLSKELRKCFCVILLWSNKLSIIGP